MRSCNLPTAVASQNSLLVRPFPTEEFLERQRLAAGSKGCEAAVMSCLAELAEVWRQLAAATARKRHLQSLRDGVREEAAAVRSFEEAGAAALHSQVRIIGRGWQVGSGEGMVATAALEYEQG